MSKPGYVPSAEKRARDERLRARRQAALQVIRKAQKGRTQVYLAAQAQVTPALMWCYLNGLCRIPREVWDRMCRALELDPETMLRLVSDAELILQPVKGEKQGKKGRRAA